MKNKEKETKCSFCDQPKSGVDIMIEGGIDSAICDSCVGVAVLLIEEAHRKIDEPQGVH